MGGELFRRLNPQSDNERRALLDAGYHLDRVLTTAELAAGDDIFFAATGIWRGTFLRGVRFTGGGALTHSVVMRGKTGTIRYIEAHHSFDMLMQISAIDYDQTSVVARNRVRQGHSPEAPDLPLLVHLNGKRHREKSLLPFLCER